MTLRVGHTARDSLPQGTACLVCGYRMDSTTGMTSESVTPADGDVSICLRCGAVALFELTPYGLRLQPLPPDQEESIMGSPDVQRLIATIREVWR